MNANDVARLKFFSENFRRYRRENEQLREALGQETESARAFDRENLELFQVVHANHERNTMGIGMTVAALL